MPVQSKVKKNVGVQGVADVRILKDALRINFADGDSYQIEKGDWKYPAGKYNITLTSQGDKVLFVSPPPLTTHLVRFEHFGNRGQNDIPSPYIQRGGPRQSKSGGSYYAPDELKASARLVVVGTSPYEGLGIVYTFPYSFEPQPGTPFTLISATASRLAKIEEFLRVAGLDLLKDDIPFSDNVLPWLESKFQSAGKIFQVALNDKGFVQTLTEVPTYLLPPALTDKKSKAAPKKRTAKK